MSRSARWQTILRRTAWQALPTVLGIVILNFFLLKLMPGDAADVIAGEAGSATTETMTMLRAKFGLDQPLLVQLWTYLTHLAHFSLGYSPRYDMPVMQLILSRLPNTLLLMGVALSLALVAGVVLGAVMAHWAGKWPDRVLSVGALLFYSTPGFWIGLLAIVLFAVRLGWLPSGGNVTIGANLHGFAYVADVARHVLLPAATLATFFVAIYARITRAAMIEVQRQDFVRTAQAKGLHPWRVTLRHVLRNALMPLTTLVGLHFGTLLGGAAVTETVFSWPGLGRLALDAVLARDFSVLLGVLLLSSLLVIVANVVVDLLQAWLDPRVG
ncbi:Glutathione transport system permease protein GsiC [Paraburkholderia hiiakae]|uniref:Glutathione transport system permease protein GsiC n=1 Tax=Paraburkholderia hiiakae TaxID=1081782 RepID=A0ABN7HNN0_9BURK|nr:ABC transporter permease [Paraburkholderia hiiakae]CAD6528570.1 Glutathione transport system permease protein GsiC [Paraburkholderia hiiakae]